MRVTFTSGLRVDSGTDIASYCGEGELVVERERAVNGLGACFADECFAGRGVGFDLGGGEVGVVGELNYSKVSFIYL